MRTKKQENYALSSIFSEPFGKIRRFDEACFFVGGTIIGGETQDVLQIQIRSAAERGRASGRERAFADSG